MSKGPEDTRTPNHKKRRERYDLIKWDIHDHMVIPKSIRVEVNVDGNWQKLKDVKLTIEDN